MPCAAGEGNSAIAVEAASCQLGQLILDRGLAVRKAKPSIRRSTSGSTVWSLRKRVSWGRGELATEPAQQIQFGVALRGVVDVPQAQFGAAHGTALKGAEIPFQVFLDGLDTCLRLFLTGQTGKHGRSIKGKSFEQPSQAATMLILVISVMQCTVIFCFKLL